MAFLSSNKSFPQPYALAISPKFLFRFNLPNYVLLLQRRQLSVDHGAPFCGGMVQLLEAVEGPRAGRDVELALHRARDVQTQRQKQYSTSGDHHPAVPRNSSSKWLWDGSKFNKTRPVEMWGHQVVFSSLE